MRQKTERQQGAAERTIKDIRRQTRKRYSSEEKIRIVLAGQSNQSDPMDHGASGKFDWTVESFFAFLPRQLFLITTEKIAFSENVSPSVSPRNGTCPCEFHKDRNTLFYLYILVSPDGIEPSTL